jgi:hypothetical protein
MFYEGMKTNIDVAHSSLLKYSLSPCLFNYRFHHSYTLHFFLVFFFFLSISSARVDWPFILLSEFFFWSLRDYIYYRWALLSSSYDSLLSGFFFFLKRACQKLRHTQTWFFVRLDHFQMGLRPHFVFLVHSWLTVLSQHFPSFYFVLASPIPSLPLSFWPFGPPPPQKKNASFSLKLENKNQIFKFFLHFIWFASLHD